MESWGDIMPIIPAGLEEPPHGLTREQKHSVENEPEDFKKNRLYSEQYVIFGNKAAYILNDN